MRKNGYLFSVFQIAFLLLVLTACAGANNSRQTPATAEPIVLLDASVESWQAGRRDGGSGTDYRLKAVINTAQPLHFDDLWIRETALSLPVSVGRTNGVVSSKAFAFAKGDTVALFASTASGAQPKTDKPAKLAGEAILSYRIEGKKAYTAVSSFTQKETLPQPEH